MVDGHDGSTTFVALHIGAGTHTKKLDDAYVRFIRSLLAVGKTELERGDAASDVAVHLTSLLEDSPLSNAGYGSNLNINAEVECDAAIMTTESSGAVTGLETALNPIQVADRVRTSGDTALSLGRLSPSMLFGAGAEAFARACGIPVSDLKSPQAVQRHRYWRDRLDSADGLATFPCDTCGVICLDKEQKLAVTSSSGGISLKQPGRIGPAAVIGAGLWAEAEVAVTCSGRGETILQTCMARTRALHIQFSTPFECAAETGYISVQVFSDSISVEFVHSTQSFAVGYEDVALMSQRTQQGQTVFGGRSYPRHRPLWEKQLLI